MSFIHFCGISRTGLTKTAVILCVSAVATPALVAQQTSRVADAQEAAQRAQYQSKLQQILNDRAGYAAAIAQRWEDAARASGRWDENFATDLQNALLKLTPDNLLAAGEAPSYEAMMAVLATGKQSATLGAASQKGMAPQAQTISPLTLGESTADLVYTPVTPCRIVDTRNAGGPLAGGTTRTFDVDGTTFIAQGGNNGPCGIPFGVSQAVAMTLTVTQPNGVGYLTAWGLGLQPLSSVINFAAGETIANTTIVPVAPGSGTDFSVFAGFATTHLVIDVVGYFAAPEATALDCTTVSSAVTAVPVNAWTAIDANCPAGRTATGGGYDSPEGTLGYPGVWVTSLPNGNGWRVWVDNQTNGPRNVQSFARCCRVPGR